MMRFEHAPGARHQAQLVQELSRAVQRALLDALLNDGTGAPGAAAAVTLPRARAACAPERLARQHPGGEAERARVKAMYERCLARAREDAAHDGAPSGHDDVGSVLARFVAANVAALRGETPTVAMIAALARQMSAVVQHLPAWRRADLPQRQGYVEELAVVAVLVRETALLAGGEGPASVEHVRQAARAYLRQLLGLEPDRLSIRENGLVLLDSAETQARVAA